MAGRIKHMERSHRSYHNYKPFATFERKANIKLAQKVTRLSLMDRVKKTVKNAKNAVQKVFHRTTDK